MENKPVRGYEDYYTISENGDVYSIRRGRTLSARPTNKGYLVVEFWVAGKRKVKHIHRLIAEAFIPNPNNKPEVNHIDGDKVNNSINNLSWVTKSEQMKHAWNTGLFTGVKGKKLNPKINKYE